MGLSRRQFTKEFKLAAVRRLEMGSSIAEVARAFEVNPNALHRWRRELRDWPGNVFPGRGKRRWEESRVAQLERKIGQQTLEIDFLKGCLQRIEEQRQPKSYPVKIEIAQDLKYAESRLGSLSLRDGVRSARLRSGWPKDSQMGLQTTGEIIVEVDRATAFGFLQIPEQLALCVPGCHDLRQVAPGSFTAVLTNEVSCPNCGNCPRKAPAIAMKHRQSPQITRGFGKIVFDDFTQRI